MKHLPVRTPSRSEHLTFILLPAVGLSAVPPLFGYIWEWQRKAEKRIQVSACHPSSLSSSASSLPSPPPSSPPALFKVSDPGGRDVTLEHRPQTFPHARDVLHNGVSLQQSRCLMNFTQMLRGARASR